MQNGMKDLSSTKLKPCDVNILEFRLLFKDHCYILQIPLNCSKILKISYLGF